VTVAARVSQFVYRRRRRTTPKPPSFVIRFHVKPLVWLEVEKSIPIHDDTIWNRLSFTRSLEFPVDWKWFFRFS